MIKNKVKMSNNKTYNNKKIYKNNNIYRNNKIYKNKMNNNKMYRNKVYKNNNNNLFKMTMTFKMITQWKYNLVINNLVNHYLLIKQIMKTNNQIFVYNHYKVQDIQKEDICI